MKILLLIDNFGAGGAQRQLINLATLLQQKKFNVEFLTYDEGDFFLPEVNRLGLRVHHVKSKTILGRILKVKREICRCDFNVVISFMDTPNFLNCITSMGTYKRKIITCERSSKESTFQGLKHKVYNWFQKYSDAIVCNSENAMLMWKHHYPQYLTKLHYIYNVVNLPSISSEYMIRKDGKTHIVVAASFQFLKNSINVAKGVARLPKDIRNKFVIDWYGNQNVTLGGNACFDQTADLINRYGLSESMVLHPSTSNIANVMQEADCVAIFSQLEGLPNAICEGMMLGKPIIMTRVSDYNKLVDATNGFLCDWNDVDSIADALKNMVESSNENLISMGTNSFNRAKEMFNADCVADDWQSLINSIV